MKKRFEEVLGHAEEMKKSISIASPCGCEGLYLYDILAPMYIAFEPGEQLSYEDLPRKLNKILK